MTIAGAAILGGRRVRANPRYRMIAVEDLPGDDRRRLAGLGVDEQTGAVLSAGAGSGLGVKAIDRDTAQLFTALAGVRGYPEDAVPEVADEDLGRLVLDGVLELETPGGFRSGPAAFEALYGPLSEQTPVGAVGRLSARALRYGAALRRADAMQLSIRLYCFNRHPLTTAWRRRLPSPAAVREELRLDGRGATARALRAEWIEQRPDPDHDGWWAWQRRSPQTSGRAAHKLYVSPGPDAVPEAFAAVVAAAAASDAVALKVGRDVAGLLRPDKLVVYFARRPALVEAAERLAGELRGVPVHGVPFSAELEPTGLLSAGMDPAPSPALRGWRGQESWRLWITNRLATALVAAAPCRTADDACRYAVARLSVEGIDTVLWRPRYDEDAWGP